MEGSPVGSLSEVVHAFWFAEALADPAQAERRMRFWFGSSREADEDIARRFTPALKDASQGLLAGWEQHPRSCLSLIIVLDQFPRNIHRAAAAAFQHDAQALGVARRGVAANQLQVLTTVEQAFFLMPFQHCEDLGGQREGVALFERIADEAAPEWRKVAAEMLRYARLHLEIIERFGRFPHRNAILGRASTPAELDYLKTNSESFGQGG